MLGSGVEGRGGFVADQQGCVPEKPRATATPATARGELLTALEGAVQECVISARQAGDDLVRPDASAASGIARSGLGWSCRPMVMFCPA